MAVGDTRRIADAVDLADDVVPRETLCLPRHGERNETGIESLGTQAYLPGVGPDRLRTMPGSLAKTWSYSDGGRAWSGA